MLNIFLITFQLILGYSSLEWRMQVNSHWMYLLSNMALHLDAATLEDGVRAEVQQAPLYMIELDFATSR